MFILRSERRKKETLINVLNERAALVQKPDDNERYI